MVSKLFMPSHGAAVMPSPRARASGRLAERVRCCRRLSSGWICQPTEASPSEHHVTIRLMSRPLFVTLAVLLATPAQANVGRKQFPGTRNTEPTGLREIAIERE